MKLKTFVFAALSGLALVACIKTEEAPTPTIITATNSVFDKKYSFSERPVWQDEFETDGKPNSSRWGYDLGGNGWGNNELQNYTDRLENARVENGMLIIEARNETSGGRPYSSARLVSKGKGDFSYGKFEIRAKLPKGVGTWPAVWMLASQSTYGTQFWPDNGEIDIMEHVGFDQDVVHGNIHTRAYNHSIGTNKGDKIKVNNASEAFHVYACEWSPIDIKMYVDGQLYFTFARSRSYGWQEWPFDKPFHLLLNIAVGGNWGGQKGVDATAFPQRMEIDYIRVYSLIESN